PYLLDIQFSLGDNVYPQLAQAVVTSPANLSAVAYEDITQAFWPDSLTNTPPPAEVPTNETSVILHSGNSKVLKAYLVLDFTASVAIGPDSNGDGISDAVDNVIRGAQAFVDQQPGSAQIGVVEFHRDDEAPQLVDSLTANKAQLDSDIAGIWTNYVQGFSS